MPDHRDWPPLQRNVARILRGLAYSLAALAGLLVLADNPPHLMALILSGLAVVGSVAALLGVVLYLWHVEFVAVPLISAAFGGYAVFEYSVGHFETAAALGFAATAVIGRGVDLWVFSANARRWQRRRRKRT